MHHNQPAGEKRPPHTGWPLQRTLGVWFSIIVILVSLAVGGLTYYLRARDLRSRIREQLAMIRDDRVHDIEQWFTNRRDDVKLWTTASGLIGASEQHAAGQPIESREVWIQQLQEIQQTHDCHAVSILDPETGDVIISSEPPGTLPHTMTREMRDRVISQSTPAHSEVFLCPLHDEPIMILAAAIRSRETGQPVGILTFYLDLVTTFYPNVLRTHNLGETGEIYLVNQEMVAQSPLQHEENASGRARPHASMATAAAAGQTGAGEAADYRGVQVMGAYGFIPGLGWGVVVKQDHDEIRRPIQQMATQIAGVTAGALLLALALSLGVSRKIAAPAAGIAEVTEQIREGNLSVRAKPVGPLELQTVARNFNAMMDQLARQLWTGDSLGSIFSSASAHNRLVNLLDEVLPKIMEITRSQAAVFYLAEPGEDSFHCIAVNGMPPDGVAERIHASAPDHLLAQAARDGEVQVLNGISYDHELRIVTQAGSSRPAALLSVPLLHSGQPIAVIGLASLYEYRPEDVEISRTLKLSLGQSIAAALANEKNLKITEELQIKNEELNAANEELQTQTEELQSQTEELQQQSEELHQQTEELARQRAAVEEADRLKSQFLSNMSHELRTPLNSIMALSQLMLARGTGNNPTKEAEYLGIIERNGRHLLNLINDILDLSKIEAGRIDLLPTSFRPDHVARRALEVARPLAEAKGLPIELQADAVPELVSDEDKVHQILLNLLSNAVKFTDKGKVVVRVKADREQVRFEVQDTGIGISEADLPSIFDEFRQVDGSTTRRHDGTGLGLAIGQKLARLLGGDITVQTQVGQGSTFVLSLPLRPSGAKIASTPAPAQSSPHGKSRSRRTKTILVVDDDPSVRNLLRTYLMESGYDVLVAANGREAIALAQENKLYAITLDVIMPDMDGWEVIRELKARPQTASVPILVVSMVEDRATALALGASGFLLKPVDRNLLLDELRRVARSRPVHHILVVDDDATTRQQLRMMLENQYEQITTAAGGNEAMRQIRDSRPDAIILDLMMPDVDGFTVLDRLRSDATTRDIPVLILTAKDLTSDDRQRLRIAVSQIVSKGSMDRSGLLAELEKALYELEEPSVSEPAGGLVLVVDDDEIAAIQIASALEDAGYQTTVARSGAEALARVREEMPDAVVLDLMMPGMDGFEVLHQLRSTAATADVPVLILTAKELTAEDRVRLADDRVRQLIQKGSVDRQQLVDVVGELLDDSQKPAPISAPATARDDRHVESDGSGNGDSRPDGVILVVEDNPDNLITIGAILDDLNWKHVHAADGEQAVRMTRELRPTLVLMDMQLPVLSGMDAVREIKSDPELTGIPIVALTAKAMRGDREKILGAGCEAYLSKPLDRHELARVLARWVS